MSELLYFWEFEIAREREAAFREATKDWSSVNNELPNGVSLKGFYEVVVGLGLGPGFADGPKYGVCGGCT